MKTETSLVARQCRLMEWADQIRNCQSRPNGMSVAQWCSMHGITTANYYYRFAQVRKACLEQVEKEQPGQHVVPVQTNQLKKETPEEASSLELSINGITIRVTETTSDELLNKVLRVAVGVK